MYAPHHFLVLQNTLLLKAIPGLNDIGKALLGTPILLFSRALRLLVPPIITQDIYLLQEANIAVLVTLFC